MPLTPNPCPDTPASVYDPTPKRVVPFVLLTSFTGIFAIIALRKLIILDWQVGARGQGRQRSMYRQTSVKSL